MKMKKAILAAILGVLILPTLTSAKPRPEKHYVPAAKTHSIFMAIFGR
jgi:hypothetical protein